MKNRTFISSIFAVALLVSGCSLVAQTDKYEFKRTSPNGQQWTNPSAATLNKSVFTLDSTGAPLFVPRSDFVSSAVFSSATTALSALISSSTLTNMGTLLKITESGGLPLWSGSAWPGGNSGGGTGTGFNFDHTTLTEPTSTDFQIKNNATGALLSVSANYGITTPTVKITPMGTAQPAQLIIGGSIGGGGEFIISKANDNSDPIFNKNPQLPQPSMTLQAVRVMDIQTPIASITATKTRGGVIKVGTGITVASGTIMIPSGTAAPVNGTGADGDIYIQFTP